MHLCYLCFGIPKSQNDLRAKPKMWLSVSVCEATCLNGFPLDQLLQARGQGYDVTVL